jgi:hypothetical protein
MAHRHLSALFAFKLLSPRFNKTRTNMQSENDVPRFLRLKDLQERGIAMTHQAVRHMQLHEDFPPGRLFCPGTRVWTVSEINNWLDSRPVEVSEQARRRARLSIEARKTARQMIDEQSNNV